MDELLRFVELLRGENLALLLLAVGTAFFSVLAAQAQKRLWHRVGRFSSRQEQQRFITLGRSHLR